jgi:hypothetical protein
MSVSPRVFRPGIWATEADVTEEPEGFDVLPGTWKPPEKKLSGFTSFGSRQARP